MVASRPVRRDIDEDGVLRGAISARVKAGRSSRAYRHFRTVNGHLRLQDGRLLRAAEDELAVDRVEEVLLEKGVRTGLARAAVRELQEVVQSCGGLARVNSPDDQRTAGDAVPLVRGEEAALVRVRPRRIPLPEVPRAPNGHLFDELRAFPPSAGLRGGERAKRARRTSNEDR